LLVFIAGITMMVIGVFAKGWFIDEVAAIFLLVGILCGVIARMNSSQIADVFARALEPSALAAVLIGVAMATKVVMDQGNISDTVAHGLVSALEYLPTTLAAVFMTLSQSIINVFIPSGSGQALVTLPIMIPVGDMLDITRQTVILAFQIGDGLTN